MEVGPHMQSGSSVQHRRCLPWDETWGRAVAKWAPEAAVTDSTRAPGDLGSSKILVEMGNLDLDTDCHFPVLTSS